ncbi:hypothetical protein ACKWTF_001498 [Chironomus riparius]
MEIDWQNVTFEFEAEEFQQTTSEIIAPTMVQQPQQINNLPKRSRKEMEEFIVQVPQKVEELGEFLMFPQDDSQYIEDNEDVIYPQQNEHIEIKETTGKVIFYCELCSLDFPSIAYFKRHQNTKKHQRALRMEQQGKKVNQKKQYVRRNSVNTRTIQVKREVCQIKQEKMRIPDEYQTTNNQFANSASITDLTSEEISILHMIDDQLMKIESENTAKDFYENFNFDLDIENEPAAKIQKMSTIEEIMADLVASSKEQAQQKLRHPLFEVQQQPIVQVQQQQQVKVQKITQKVQIKEEQSKIQCQMCPRAFNLRCHLTQHMNIVHSGNRNFKCTKCGKKYPSQELLNQHMEKHLGDKPFRCSKCVKSYNNKVDLKRHFKTHEEIRDYICNMCGGGFVRSDHLEKHLLVHQRQIEDGRLVKRRGPAVKSKVF